MSRFLPILALFSLAACVETINMSPAEEGIGVYCILKKGDKQTLKLSRIDGGMGVGDLPIENAKAWILRNRDTFRFVHVGNGIYETTMSPQHGYLYRLEIEARGQKIWAETVFPEDLIISYWKSRSDYRAPWYTITNYSQTEPYDKPCNFILYSAHPDDNSSIWTNHSGADAVTLGEYFFSSDDIYWNPYEKDYETYHDPSYLPFDGKRLKGGPGYKQMVIIRHDGNYSNGIPFKELKDYGVTTEKAFIISPPNKDNSWWTDSFVSDSYADYLRYCKKRENNSGDLLSNVFDREAIINIHGGFGVFGAKTSKTQVFQR